VIFRDIAQYAISRDIAILPNITISLTHVVGKPLGYPHTKFTQIGAASTREMGKICFLLTPSGVNICSHSQFLRRWQPAYTFGFSLHDIWYLIMVVRRRGNHAHYYILRYQQAIESEPANICHVHI